RKTFESLAAHDPQSGEARTAVGIMLQAQKRDTDARGWYEQALSIDPRQAIAANNLARLYATDRSNIDEAVRLARLAEARLPDDPGVEDTVKMVDKARGAFAGEARGESDETASR